MIEFDVLVEQNDVSQDIDVERVQGVLNNDLVSKIKRAQELLMGNEDITEGIILKYSLTTHDLRLRVFTDEEATKESDMRFSGMADIFVHSAGVTITERTKHVWEQQFSFFVNV